MDMDQAVIDSDDAESSKYDSMERECFMEPWLNAGTIALLGGKRGSGKTWMALVLAYALTRACSLGRWQVEKAVGVLYIDTEMPQGEMLPRIRGFSKGVGHSHAPLGWYNHQYGENTIGLRLGLKYEAQREELLAYLKENRTKYRIIIIDNKSTAFPGIDENDKKDWDAIGEWMLAIRRLDIATILVCHFGKSARAGIRGSSSVEDIADVSISVESPPRFQQGEQCKFQVAFSKSRGLNEHVDPFTVSIVHRDGGIQWETDKRVITMKDRIIKCLGMQMPQHEIVDRLHASKAHVSQAHKHALATDLIFPSGGFTAKGRKIYDDLEPFGYEMVNFADML